ncbi:hypothetical protein ABIA38_005476 [Embleya sp. AB8]
MRWSTIPTSAARTIESEGKVYWAKSGARYGYSTAIVATRELSRTLVYSVDSTDAKGESLNPVAQRIVLAAVQQRR